MLPRLAALCAACLALPQLASADRFYFGSADNEKQMVVGTPDYLEGVLVSRENGNYIIRIVGGEITVPESAIYRIERDALTMDALTTREKDNAPRLAQANEQRRAMFADAERRRRDAIAARREAAQAPAARQELDTVKVLDAGYDAVLDVYDALYPPSTPVTPDRPDRGLSRYLEAQEHFERTSH